MNQLTSREGLQSDTWTGLDAAVRPTAVSASLRGHEVSVASRAAGFLGNVGERLRSETVTRRVPAAESVGRALQQAGGYLERRQMAGVRADSERLIVRRPLVSLALAAVLGYAAGRMVWR